MPESFEEEYEDVLQNIEFALVQVYRAHPEMTDWDAQEAVNGLIRAYQAEAGKKPIPRLKLSNLQQETFDLVKHMCEWRLGREQMSNDQGTSADAEMEPKTLEEIVACLKRVRRSIETWNKELGRRGYYDFVSEYVG
jgi:hypothetical protein